MVEHVNIVDADRHEAKGASTASSGQYLRAAGNGTTSWVFPNYNDLANRPTSQGYLPALYGASAASVQQPSVVNTPVQIEFGQALSGTGVALAADGALTFTNAGQYLINLNFRVGRIGGVSGVARLFLRILVNGAPQLRPIAVLSAAGDSITPVSLTISYNASVNDVLTVQLIRDSAGVNDGGLVQISPSLAGWTASPTASINISRFGGLV